MRLLTIINNNVIRGLFVTFLPEQNCDDNFVSSTTWIEVLHTLSQTRDHESKIWREKNHILCWQITSINHWARSAS